MHGVHFLIFGWSATEKLVFCDLGTVGSASAGTDNHQFHVHISALVCSAPSSKKKEPEDHYCRAAQDHYCRRSVQRRRFSDLASTPTNQGSELFCMSFITTEFQPMNAIQK